MKILIVDNNLENCRQLETSLKKEGHTVGCAHEGREALTLLHNEHYDCIIAEVCLPAMDGFQLLRVLTLSDTLYIPFVFLTDVLDEEDASFVRTLGADLLKRSRIEDIPKILKTLTPPNPPLEETVYLQKYTHILQKILNHTLQQTEEIQKKLSQSERKYQNLFEGAHDATFIMNREGGHIEANKKASELLGYTLEEFRALSFREIVVPSSIPDSENKLVKLLEGEDIPVYEKEFRTKNGKKIPVEVSVSGVQDESGEVAYIQSIVRDITERKTTEQFLLESEEKYRTLVENLNVGVYRSTPGKEGRFIDVNQAFVEMLGYQNKEDLLKLKVSKTYMNPEDRKKFSEKILRQGFAKNEELHLKRRDGTLLIVSDTSTPVYSNGKVLYFDGITEDITERKKMEEALRESEEKYRTLVENSKDSIVIIDLRGNVQFANKATEELTGYIMEEGLGMNVRQITPLKYWPKSLAMLRKALGGEPIAYFESVIRRKDKKLVPVESGGQAIFKDGKVVGIQIITRDITERKKAEEQIRKSLREKEVLLKEIHHRVKNNMQIISSLLNLQAAHIEDDWVLEAFKDCQNRIKSMALVHEKLYQSEDLASVNFRDYVKSLTTSLIRSSRYNVGRVTLKIEAEDISLGSDQALPCGLIVNELVSNSLKHAFPHGRTGEILIRLHPRDENTVELTVADNGIGIPESIDLKGTKSLGLRLVTILAEDQLNGEIRLDRKGGTGIYITFKTR